MTSLCTCRRTGKVTFLRSQLLKTAPEACRHQLPHALQLGVPAVQYKTEQPRHLHHPPDDLKLPSPNNDHSYNRGSRQTSPYRSKADLKTANHHQSNSISFQIVRRGIRSHSYPTVDPIRRLSNIWPGQISKSRASF